MDTPPSNRGVAQNALPDELLEFIDEETLLKADSQAIEPAPTSRPIPVVANPAKPVLVERVNAALPSPGPFTPGEPIDPPETIAPPESETAIAAKPADRESPLPAIAAQPAASAAPTLRVMPRPSAVPPETPAASAQRHQVSVADLLSPKIERSWQEAVAIILELLDGWPDDVGCPRAEAATVSTSGAVRASMDATCDGHPVTAAARLLGDLLPPSRVPPDLQRLLDRDSREHPEHASIKEFVNAVSYFGRPNRRPDTSAFCERAVEFYRGLDADRELIRLRTKVNAEADRDSAGVAGWIRRRAPRNSQSALAAGLWVLIILNASALMWFAVTPAPARPPLPPTELATPEPAMAANLDVFVGPLPPAAESRAKRTVTPEARVVPPRLIAQPIPVATLRPAPATAPGNRQPEFKVFVREVPPERPVATRGTVDPNVIYSDEDGDVTPAVLMHPPMPIVDAGATADGPVSEFELIIDRAGRVERVRLTSAVNQLQDKMLLAAAKAWLFQPAVRDGQPVRYQLRLRVSR